MTQLAVIQGGQTQLGKAPRTFEEIKGIATVMYSSGLFKDLQNASQAVVKLMAGEEYGMGPFDALQNVHIIQGKPTLSANAMAAAVKAHPKYDYRVLQMDDNACKVEFYQQGEAIGVSEFTKEQARVAGTQNMAKFGRNMMFARAMSNGVRWYCPDVFKSAVYTPEELGAEVDGEGNVVSAPVVNAPQPAPVAQATEAVEPLPNLAGTATIDQLAEYGKLRVQAQKVGLKPAIAEDTMPAAKLQVWINKLRVRIDEANAADNAVLEGELVSDPAFTKAPEIATPITDANMAAAQANDDYGVFGEDVQPALLEEAPAVGTPKKGNRKHAALVMACDGAGLDWSKRTERIAAINAWLEVGPWETRNIKSTTELNDGQLSKLAFDIKEGAVKW